ncbi:MAG TPA: hypothetical protein PLZ57_07020 [Pseudobdellovibrionaceae bacterium]|nr:hypothetical protein [Pseudobdellovibrionaceae bacterium]
MISTAKKILNLSVSTLLAAAVFSAAAPARAESLNIGTFFLLDSELPTELQNQLRRELEKRCRFDANTRFEEVRTEVRVEQIDQGVIDHFYTTHLIAREFNANGTQNFTAIVVESSWYAGSNPTPEAYAQIDRIDAAYGRCQ